MRKFSILGFIFFLIFPLFAEKVLFMRPVTRDIGRADASDIVRALDSMMVERFNIMHYRDLDRRNFDELRRCGSDAICWADNSVHGSYEYVILSLISKDRYDEILVRFVLLDLIEERMINDSSQTYMSPRDVTDRALYRQIREVTDSIYDRIRFGTTSRAPDRGRSSRDDRFRDDGRREDEARRRAEEQRRREEEARRREEEARRRLEEERRQRELELERRRQEEERRRREAERQRRIEEERRRREEERERERLEQERRRRELEREREMESRRHTLESNAQKLARARQLVLEMCAEGRYNKAIEAIVKVSELKCECEEDARVLALKTQLLNFNRIRNRILEGVKLLDHNLILDNLGAAKALDEYIVPGGTEFSRRVDKIEAIGHFARARDLERRDSFDLAKESYEKCLELDPDKKECRDWLNNIDNIVKMVFDKAMVMRSFNPTKSKELLRSILRIVTAENEYYKRAEEELQKMEF